MMMRKILNKETESLKADSGCECEYVDYGIVWIVEFYNKRDFSLVYISAATRS